MPISHRKEARSWYVNTNFNLGQHLPISSALVLRHQLTEFWFWSQIACWNINNVVLIVCVFCIQQTKMNFQLGYERPVDSQTALFLLSDSSDYLWIKVRN